MICVIYGNFYGPDLYGSDLKKHTRQSISFMIIYRLNIYFVVFFKGSILYFLKSLLFFFFLSIMNIVTKYI